MRDDFEARDFACLFGRLPLRVVEVRRNGDDGLGHFFAQEVFRGCFQLARIIAEISGGLYTFPEISTRAVVVLAFLLLCMERGGSLR